ncbi:ribbon-helix-helix protein, CopG family [Novosphingobium sp. fls2-241-R2A-195]|uniref:plasmid mobilization protein n=1 Tax=Novosphingobium sp. fls2-241-R2A-195 TaxID=3040296 RepID=UPI00254BBD99|nr:ribbon-helix-helix protein, CopG family [Novosphingobium sp. fls2-241-R2A-195]
MAEILEFRALCVTVGTLNVEMTVEPIMQNVHVTFRANEAVVAALSERARSAGCSLSEYLRAMVREKVNLH